MHEEEEQESEVMYEHPAFWGLQDDVADLPADEDDQDLDANPELADILQYLFVDQPGALPAGFRMVEAERWEQTAEEAAEGRRARLWSTSWTRVVIFGCIGTVCAAGLWAIPRWTWAENVIQEKWPSVKMETVGRIGAYAALFVVLCLLLAGVDHPYLARTLVHVHEDK